ncbi:hypothetical protein ACLMJK_009280 [Lecanora helva]
MCAEKSRFRPCGLLFSLLKIAAVVSASASASLGDALQFLNATGFEGGSTIDPRFTITSEYGMPKLPGIPCLMNAVNAMQDLALEDFEEPLVPETYFLHDFPEVMIAPEAPVLGGAIQTRYIIWGLWMGVLAMIEQRMFQTVVFTLNYDRHVVGSLRIARPEAHSPMEGTSGNSDNMTAVQRLAIREHVLELPHNVTQEYNDGQLAVSFRPIGPPLVDNDVILAVLYGLVYTAYFKSTQEVNSIDLSLPSPSKMQIQASAATPDTSPADVPKLEYRWIIKSLGQIPQYMVQRKSFSGVTWRTVIDGKLIGTGQLVKKSDPED